MQPDNDYSILNKPEYSEELRIFFEDVMYDLNIPKESEVRISHGLTLKDPVGTKSPDGLKAEKVVSVNIRMPAGDEVTLQCPPTDVVIKGRVAEGNLRYVEIDPNSVNAEKRMDKTIIKTTGFTELNGLPSGVNDTILNTLEDFEEKYGLDKADQLDSNLSNLMSVIRYDGYQPDDITVKSKEGEVLVQQTTLNKSRILTDVKRSISDIIEQAQQTPDVNLDDWNIVSKLNDNGQVVSELMPKSYLNDLPEGIKDKMLSSYDFNEVRKAIADEDDFNNYVKISDIEPSKPPTDKELLNTFITNTDVLKEQNGVIARENRQFRALNYDQISKPYQDKFAILQFSSDGNSPNSLAQHFHKNSPNITEVAIGQLEYYTNEERERVIKHHIDELAGDFKGQKQLILIALDEDAKASVPDLQDTVEEVISKSSAYEMNIGVISTNKDTKEFLDSKKPSERLQAIKHIGEAAVDKMFWEVEDRSANRLFKENDIDNNDFLKRKSLQGNFRP